MELREIADGLTPDTDEVRLVLRKGTVATGGGTVNATVYLGGSSAAATAYFPQGAPADGAVCYVLQQGPLLVGL